MRKHTRGPWVARQGDVLNPDRPWGIVKLLSKRECYAVDGDHSLHGKRSTVIAEVTVGDHPEMAEADARLIAEAPAMLKLIAAYRNLFQGLDALEARRILKSVRARS